MRHLRTIFELTNPYAKVVEWIKPDQEYFKQEQNELLGNDMRFQAEEFLNPKNYDAVVPVMGGTMRFIAQSLDGDANLNDDRVKEILLRPGTEKRLESMWGELRHKIMSNPVAQREAISLFGMGKMVDWPEDKIRKTFYMGKPSIVYKGNKEMEIDQVSSRMMSNFDKLDHTQAHRANIQKFRDHAKSGEVLRLPAPFVMRLPVPRDGYEYTLIGGHKRSTIAHQLGVPIKVWLIDLSGNGRLNK